MRPNTPSPNTRQPAARVATAVAAAALVASLAFGTAARAGEEQVVMFRDRVPEASELAGILFPTPGPAVTLRGGAPARPATTRGLRPVSMAELGPAEPAVEGRVQEQAPAPTGFGFNIHFVFDSVEVMPESRLYLDKVGEALRMEQSRGQPVLIVGHTDATGPADYNRALSERRAAAVKRYLQDRHGIAPERLRIVGHGEQRPLPGTDPENWTNRRVEFYPAS